MQTVSLPTRLIHELEKINRKFFWEEDDQQRKLHTVDWDTNCRAKEGGALDLGI